MSPVRMLMIAFLLFADSVTVLAQMGGGRARGRKCPVGRRAFVSRPRL